MDWTLRIYPGSISDSRTVEHEKCPKNGCLEIQFWLIQILLIMPMIRVSFEIFEISHEKCSNFCFVDSICTVHILTVCPFLRWKKKWCIYFSENIYVVDRQSCLILGKSRWSLIRQWRPLCHVCYLVQKQSSQNNMFQLRFSVLSCSILSNIYVQMLKNMCFCTHENSQYRAPTYRG